MYAFDKAFTVRTAVTQVKNLNTLKASLPFDKGDLVLTEDRLMDSMSFPPYVRVLSRDEICPHGPITEQAVIKAVRAAGANFSRVIGIGGGATLDLAKLLTLEQVLPLHQLFEPQARLKKIRRLILIPATPGTGSEVTPFCAVYFENIGAQLILTSEQLCADEALLCPQLLENIPFTVFAASSFDAFTHAFESYLSALATPFSRALSLEALTLLIKSWQDIARNGLSVQNANLPQVQTAGTMAGMGYANAGCAAVHALSYPLSVRLKIHHGEANYLVFKAVWELYDRKNPGGALAVIKERMAELFGCKPEEAFAAFDSLCLSLIARKRLSSYGMQENQVLEFTDMVMTRQNMLIANGYTPVSAGEIATIYQALL